MLLIEGGEVFAPEALGVQSILVDDERIMAVGEIDRSVVERLGLRCQVLDARECVVVPGFIDPHQHLLGGSGEGGFHRQSPPIFLQEIVGSGITTVVGVLGTDTTTKTAPGLLARVKGLNQEGITARMWIGGYDIPPVTITGDVRHDILFVDEILGAGELAISDERSLQAGVDQIARVVLDVHVAGLLSGKAGVSHFHVGPGEDRLEPLRQLLDRYQVDPSWIYPTHITRSEKLLKEAVALARRGSYVDTDTAIDDVGRWIRLYVEEGGPTERLTISSDAGGGSPRRLFEGVREAIVGKTFELATMLPFVTTNTAAVLGMKRKGRIRRGKDADLLLLSKDDLEIRHLFARGEQFVREGNVCRHEGWQQEGGRAISPRFRSS